MIRITWAYPATLSRALERWFSPARAHQNAPRFRPQVEALEERAVPTVNFNMSAAPSPVTAGQNVTYTLTLQEDQSDFSVLVSDLLPPNTTFVSAAQTGGQTQFAETNPPPGTNGMVRFTSPTLLANDLVTFQIVAGVNSSSPNGPFTNTARVSSIFIPSPGDAAPATATSTAFSSFTGTKTGSPNPVTAGQNITYTLSVTNSGPSNAQGVTVTDAVPQGTTFVSASPVGETGFVTSTPPVGGTGNVTFTRGTVPAGASTQFTLVFNVNIADSTGTVITNSANVTSSTASTSNISSASTSVVGVALVVTASPVFAFAGVPLNNATVATFVDTNGPAALGTYSASINWGDGTTPSAGTITQNGTTFTVQGSHLYLIEGSVPVTVTVSNTDGRTGSGSNTATVDGYITTLYENVLNRAPDQPGLQFWVSQENSGASRQAIAQDFWISAEHRAIEVNQFYTTILGRPADAAGQAFWVNQLLAGVPESFVVASFFASPEFTASHPTADSFVTALYADIFGRAPDPVGQSFWDQVVQTGTVSRFAVASAFLSAPESDFLGISQDFEQFLGRAPSAAETQNFFSLIQSGSLNPCSLAATILGSQEYLNRQIALFFATLS